MRMQHESRSVSHWTLMAAIAVFGLTLASCDKSTSTSKSTSSKTTETPDGTKKTTETTEKTVETEKKKQ